MQSASSDLYTTSSTLYASYLFRFCSFLALGIVQVPFLQYVRTKPAGTQRILAALPLLAANLFLPLLFDQQQEIISRCVSAFLMAWLTNFKVRLYFP